MNERTKELIALMQEHNLSAADVGALINKSAQTVRVYRCKSEDKIIRPNDLELLKFKLATKKAR